MSVKAMTWVFENSPYTLGSRLVHLAIADIVNDDHDWQLWAAQPKLADKAKVSVPTVSGALKRMVEDGFLEVVEQKPGHPTVYRFLRPDTPQESEGSTSKNPRGTPQEDQAKPPKSTDSRLLSTQEEPKVNAKATDDPLVRKAHELTVLAHEQPVKPTCRGGFVAVLGLIEAELRAGQPVKRIEAAIRGDDVTWTSAGLRTAIGKAAPKRDPLRGRNADGGGLADTLRFLEEHPEEESTNGKHRSRVIDADAAEVDEGARRLPGLPSGRA